MEDEQELQRMAALVIEIERLRHEFQPMPDDIMDHLADARFVLAEVVMTTPASCPSDLAAKLRMLAATNCDDCSFDPTLPEWLAVLQAEAVAISQDQFGPPAVFDRKGMEAVQ